MGEFHNRSLEKMKWEVPSAVMSAEKETKLKLAQHARLDAADEVFAGEKER